ncbi:MAG: glycine cleavage system protein GcvH [Phycisphaerae bacterium]
MDVPADRKYRDTHEWHRLEGDVATIGITQFAADELTDITYVDLPEIGATVVTGESFGVVESVKATSDLLSGVNGTIVAVNAELDEHPEWVNEDPFGKGWVVRVKISDPSQLDALLSAEAYTKKIAG